MKNFKKLFFVVYIGLVVICFTGTEVKAEDPITVKTPSVILMEASTGQILYEKNADEQRSPASITKIMTLLLVFDELQKGTITLEEEAITSAYAKSMGGSQVFLEEGETQSVEDLIKCIVIASGNDASVVMAEHIAGSEQEFVKRMNDRAKELGLTNTVFEDCCGLTDSKGHYTTAADVAVISRELITKYPQVLTYSCIWMDKITHETNQGSKEFGLTNTNKLIRSYNGCVGLKTGSTSTAGFCVSAVANRNEIQLISVVMGAENPKTRFQDAGKMLDYGFGICHMYVDENEEKLPSAVIKKAIQKEVSCVYESDFRYLDTNNMDFSKIKKELKWNSKAEAPIMKGDIAGHAIYYLDDKELGRVNLLYAESIEAAGYFDYLKQCFGFFLQRNA